MELLTKMEDIESVFYSSRSKDEITSNLVELFKSQNNMADTLVADKIQEYINITEKNVLEEISYMLKGYSDFLTETSNKIGIKIELIVRQKDLLGLLKKAILYVNTDRPLTRIVDMIGFRVIIGSEKADDKNTIAICDQITNFSIQFFINNGFLPFEKEPILDSEKFNPAEHPEVYVTKKKDIFPCFSKYVKDYTRKPKWNGYQSLHVPFKNSSTGMIIEGQFRTSAMNERAENNPDVEHNGYKQNRYWTVDLNVDPKRIIADGFKVIEKEENDLNGEKKLITELIDPEGILKSVVMPIN